MSKSYKFRGEVNHSFSGKKRGNNLKERLESDKNTKDTDNKTEYESDDQYSDWEEEGDFEKFDKKRW